MRHEFDPGAIELMEVQEKLRAMKCWLLAPAKRKTPEYVFETDGTVNEKTFETKLQACTTANQKNTGKPMPEARIVQRFKVCDLNGWSGADDELYIPENTQGVRFEAFSAVEEIDNLRQRLLMIVVLTLGPQYSEDTELKDLEEAWMLVTPFGSLHFEKNEFSSCTLRENGNDLVFTYTTDWPDEDQEEQQSAPRLQ